MPATKVFAGMARSYGCPAKSFSDTREIIVVIKANWNNPAYITLPPPPPIARN